MTYKNPENYLKILVRPHGPVPKMDEKDERKWAVAGVTRYEDVFRSGRPVGIVEYIKGDFANEQLAEAWMKVYLDRYVKQHMPIDFEDFEPVAEPIDGLR